MRILITGGYGFIGSHVAERFFKEGNSVFIIDDLSTGSKANVKIDHKFYNLSVTDKKCEEIFRMNNIDVVVHLAAQVDVSVSEADAHLDSQSNVLGLVNILDLAKKYGVKKFIFASSAAVYGDTDVLPIAEDALNRPMSVYGTNKAIGEFYCRQWKELYGLDTIVLRFANVYGPRQGVKGEAGVISIFMKQIMEGQELVIFGDGKQTRDYVYVEDVADAVYRAAGKTPEHGVFNISTNSEHSLLDLVDTLGQLEPVKGIRHEDKRKGDIYRSTLDNTRAKAELEWAPKYSFDDGLLKTFRWYQTEWSRGLAAATVATGGASSFAIRPYFENLLLFALVALVSYNNAYGGPVDFRLGLDYNYVYIAIMGFLYGKRQSLLATVLSAGILIGNYVLRGGDLVAMLYQAQYLAHLATYLFFGVVTGYAIDNKERIFSDTNNELDNLKDRYTFLERMYLEGSQIKEELYTQIVNSDDSIGKIYNIVRELDSLEIENIYTAAAGIIASVMKTKGTAIYTVSKNHNFLRLKTKASDAPNHLANSVRISDHPNLKEMMKTKKVFVNKEMDSSYPDMIAPILYEGEVIAVVELYGLAFESLTLYHENLFKVTVLLISEALTKAYLYEQGVQDKKYLNGTRVLTPAEFGKVEAEIDRRKDSFSYETALLKLSEKRNDFEELYHTLMSCIRAEDYVGLREDGFVYVLLLNISENLVTDVLARLKNAGIDSAEVQGESHAH